MLTPHIRYQFQPNFNGWSGQTIFRSAFRLSLFGGAAAVGALLFTSGIPRIQHDILDVRLLRSWSFRSDGELTVMQKIPGMGQFYHKEVHPQDNPF
ncbi:Cytochrome b-c1 complex, subunit 10 [Beauveria brongniartii RCEF 3172]|uniref:Cytochrome b-c1 complex, subunit 10 n=1 Tax=Beauveria brongniartii RCEF 3172 TaxID=1081107 RepID=A0A167IGF0_9HYPO|nr:Cytochrome b-c1 complex, subunit 10 [Beauveria brongniartii RCEF 3172]